MCGVFSYLSLQKEVKRTQVEDALRVMKHRGPDEDDILFSKDKRTALGHVRLSIVDLSGGRQPISNEDNTIHIIANGEFYDDKRIREELRTKGHSFKTESDSEIALHLYEEYGFEFFKHLRGEFAFIILDENKNELLAVRDRYGVKPLYYYHDSEKILFTSEAKALFAAGIPAAWDYESYYHAANWQYVRPDRSLFKDIFQVEPGHYLRVKEGKIQDSCYWDINFPEGKGSAVQDADSLIEEFGSLFKESVKLRLRADIPVCCHLSGGLDSSAVAAAIAASEADRTAAFSICFEADEYNEFAVAKETAEALNMDFHPIRVRQGDLIKHFSDAVYFSEGLAINGHLGAKYILNREIRKAGFKVALTGEGADEVLAGYPHLREDYYLYEGQKNSEVEALRSTNTVSAGIMMPFGEELPLAGITEKLGYSPSFLKAKSSFAFRLRKTLSDDFLSSYKDQDRSEIFLNHFDIQGQLAGRHPVYKSMYLWSKSALTNYILKTLGDGMEMAHSIEGRLPFLDHHLVEFLNRVPLNLKIKDGIEKYILREALKAGLTEKVYKKQKHPFLAPPVSKFSDKSSETLLQDTLRSDSFRELPFYNQGKIINILDKLPKMEERERAATDPVLMMALTTCFLKDRLQIGLA